MVQWVKHEDLCLDLQHQKPTKAKHTCNCIVWEGMGMDLGKGTNDPSWIARTSPKTGGPQVHSGDCI